MSVFTRLSLTASHGNEVLVTDVASSSLSASKERMIQWSAAGPSYEASESFAQCEYDAVMDNAVGTLPMAEIVDVKDEKASKLRLRLSGSAPGMGESHFVFPSR